MSRSACVYNHKVAFLSYDRKFLNLGSLLFHIANQSLFYLSSLYLDSLRHEIILEGKPHPISYYLIT
jgi:hypothetical protein